MNKLSDKQQKIFNKDVARRLGKIQKGLLSGEINISDAYVEAGLESSAMRDVLGLGKFYPEVEQWKFVLEIKHVA